MSGDDQHSDYYKAQVCSQLASISLCLWLVGVDVRRWRGSSLFGKELAGVPAECQLLSGSSSTQPPPGQKHA